MYKEQSLNVAKLEEVNQAETVIKGAELLKRGELGLRNVPPNILIRMEDNRACSDKGISLKCGIVGNCSVIFRRANFGRPGDLSSDIKD